MINLKSFHYKKIAILGYGREGKATTHFLLQHGIIAENIFILDKTIKNTPEGVNTIFGKTHTKNLDTYDIIFRTAGISTHLEIFKGIEKKITTQTQFFFNHYKGKIIGITGTKGKTTTTMLIYKTLQNAGLKVKLVGNIGKALLEEINRNTTYDYIIFELSSYMLDGLNYQLDIGVLTNFYHEHHIDWHGGYEQYKKTKFSIIQSSKVCLIGSQIVDEYSHEIKTDKTTKIYGFHGSYIYQSGNFFINNTIVGDDKKMKLPGNHNKYNATAVLGICNILKIDASHFFQTLKSFSGVEHRCEDIGIHHAIRWINDAIATTPESTIAALETYKDTVDTIFLGGKNGGYNFSELVKKIETYHIKNIILFPDSGEKIKKLLALSQYNILETTDMKKAVDFAKKHTEQGKIALLSCASPSYSIRKDFEEKGNLFKQYVTEEN